MLLNITNHSSTNWPALQMDAARELGGEVIDLGFPNIPATSTEEEVSVLVDEYTKKVLESGSKAVVVQGEFTFTFGLINALKAQGVKCYAATTERRTVEEPQPDGSVIKKSIFDFCKFRQYV